MQKISLNRILFFFLSIGIIDIYFIMSSGYLSGDFSLVKSPNISFLEVIIIFINYIIPLIICRYFFNEKLNFISKREINILTIILIVKLILGIIFKYGIVGSEDNLPSLLRFVSALFGRINLNIILPVVLIFTKNRFKFLLLLCLIIAFSFRTQSLYPLFLTFLVVYLNLSKKLFLIASFIWIFFIFQGLSFVDYAYTVRDSLRSENKIPSYNSSELNQSLSRKLTGRISGISNFIIFKKEYNEIKQLAKKEEYSGAEYILYFFEPIISPLKKFFVNESSRSPTRLLTLHVDPSTGSNYSGSSYGVILGGFGSLYLFSKVDNIIISLLSIVFILLVIFGIKYLNRSFLNGIGNVILSLSVISALISMSPSEMFNILQTILILGILLKIRINGT